MNHGRIEQVDDTVTIYTAPKTRFVAGFIGRTNLLDGARQTDRIVFPGFSVPTTGLTGNGASFSIRPQTITLRRDGNAPGKWCIPGRLEERAYLGDYWEYEVRAADAEIRLRVNAPPDDMHTVGEEVWMEIDPSRIASVPGPEGDL
jgi:iron(III) transport system ATP-binding protein